MTHSSFRRIPHALGVFVVMLSASLMLVACGDRGGAEGGWASLKVEDRRMEQPITLDAARPQIVRFLTYDQVRDLLEKLRSRAKVQTLIGAPQDVPGQPKEPADAPPAATPAAPAQAAPPAPAKAAKP